MGVQATAKIIFIDGMLALRKVNREAANYERNYFV